jgi:hypothetical protein
MATSFNQPLFPHDIAFTGQMGQLDRAREAAEARPTDFARRGGAALQQRGDMYTSLFQAAQRAAADRRNQEQNRQFAWSEEEARKRAMANRIGAESVSSLVSGVGGLAQDVVRRGTEVSTREMDEGDLKGRFEGLLESGLIEKVVDPTTNEWTGRWKYTPEGAFKEFHRGPYWWESPTSTGGWSNR